jgi:hypothetical protein
LANPRNPFYRPPLDAATVCDWTQEDFDREERSARLWLRQQEKKEEK